MPSALFFFSIGRAVENKPLFDPSNPRESSMLNVLALETNGALDGEVNFNPVESTVETTDFAGNAFSVKGTSNTGTPCEWLPFGGNRVSPPDIRRNEKVEIWRLGDTDQYYWRDVGKDTGLRTRETVILVFGATDQPGGHGFDLSRCYFLEVSSHKGLITFQTSKDLNEPYAYTAQINTKEGYLTFQDDIKTEISIVSRDRHVKLSNPDGSLVEIMRKKVKIEGPEEISFQSGPTKFVMTPAGTTWTSAAVKVKKG